MRKYNVNHENVMLALVKRVFCACFGLVFIGYRSPAAFT